MADVSRLTGDYTIPAQSTQVFMFWADPYRSANRYFDKARFDVSIAPEFDGVNAVITPLVEVKRGRTSYPLRDAQTGEFLGIQQGLSLTLQNDNDFPVTFLAAHVLIL